MTYVVGAVVFLILHACIRGRGGSRLAAFGCLYIIFIVAIVAGLALLARS